MRTCFTNFNFIWTLINCSTSQGLPIKLSHIDYNINTNLRTLDNYRKGGTTKLDILLGQPKNVRFNSTTFFIIIWVIITKVMQFLIHPYKNTRTDKSFKFSFICQCYLYF